MVENGVEGLFQTTSHFMKILNSWYFMEVFKPMIFNKGFETYDIL